MGSLHFFPKKSRISKIHLPGIWLRELRGSPFRCFVFLCSVFIFCNFTSFRFVCVHAYKFLSLMNNYAYLLSILTISAEWMEYYLFWFLNLICLIPYTLFGWRDWGGKGKKRNGLYYQYYVPMFGLINEMGFDRKGRGTREKLLLQNFALLLNQTIGKQNFIIFHSFH